MPQPEFTCCRYLPLPRRPDRQGAAARLATETGLPTEIVWTVQTVQTSNFTCEDVAALGRADPTG